MPSSLTRVLPITLVFSTCPPVSVLVRARPTSLDAFLGGMDSGTSPISGVGFPSQAYGRRISLSSTLRGCPRSTNAWDPLSYPVPPSVIAVGTWYRNINRLAIAYAFRPRLSSRLTLGGRTFPRKPWTIGGRDSHSSFATHAGIRTRIASTAGLHRRFAGYSTLSYRSDLRRIPQLRY